MQRSEKHYRHFKVRQSTELKSKTKQNKMLSLCSGLSKPCFAGSLLLAVAIGN